MDGTHCEGRYLGVKLDKYSNPGGGGNSQEDVDMVQSPNRARSERPSRNRASHTGRQVRCGGLKLVVVLTELKLSR